MCVYKERERGIYNSGQLLMEETVRVTHTQKSAFLLFHSVSTLCIAKNLERSSNNIMCNLLKKHNIRVWWQLHEILVLAHVMQLSI